MNMVAEKISDSEAEIMKVVWSFDKAVTYTEIRKIVTEKLDWTSPTVNTLVNRLVKKGALLQKKQDTYYYTPTITEEEFMKARTDLFLQKVYDGNIKGLLSALVSRKSITEEDIEELQEFWEQGREEK